MITEIADRLRETCPSLSAVDMAEDLDALAKGTAPRHAATFVMPYRKKAEPNELATGFRQKVIVQVLVAFFVRRHDDTKGGKRAALYDDLETEIEAALAGWEPEFVEDPFELVAGQTQPFGNGATINVMTWQTSRSLEA